MDGVESTKASEKTEQKEQIAREYGLDLEQIKHIKLDSGKEFFQFFDKKTKEVKMVENIDYKKDLKQQFEESQKDLSESQSENAKENAEKTFNHNLKYKNKEAELISIEEFKNNKYRYKRRLRKLDTKTRNKIVALLSKQKDLELEYINLENGIGIDEKQNTIDVKYDFINNKAEFVEPLTISYTSTLHDSSELEDEDIDLSDVDFNAVLDQLEIADSVPQVTDEREIQVSGVTINAKTIAQAYDTPEILDKDQSISKKQKEIYKSILDAIKRRFAKKQTKQNQKQYVYKQNNKNNAA